jgi:phage terminase large subunit-like protein
MVSTTPRPIPIIRELLAMPTCVVTRATTYANRAHLAPTFLAKILAKYEGTRLGRQELEAQAIDDVDGALWTRSMIRHTAQAPDLRRVVVAIDPAVSSGGAAALTGIVVAAVGVDGRGYVLEDASGRYSPHAWATRARLKPGMAAFEESCRRRGHAGASVTDPKRLSGKALGCKRFIKQLFRRPQQSPHSNHTVGDDAAPIPA